MNLRNFTTVEERRDALAQELGVRLPQIGTFSLEEDVVAKKNCENMIGVTQIPLGIAGPLEIHTAEGNMTPYYIPIATTEGALVASISRGCKAINESGGAVVVSNVIGITRAPVFTVSGIQQGRNVIDWVNSHLGELKQAIESTSSHLTLLDIKPWMVGRCVYLRFRCNSQDAMGMNMITIAVTKAAAHIEQETGAKLVAVSGNMCVDKKANMLNFIEGRGTQVWAEVHLSHAVLTAVLKTTAEKLWKTAQAKLVYGSILSGTIGANAHVANVLAAIFLATGQDVAHIAESSSAVTTVEQKTDGLYVSVYIPDLVVGTVGGGTGLGTQQEALTIMGATSSVALAEKIVGAVLAGEISLLASLSENSLATAHQVLGRGGK